MSPAPLPNRRFFETLAIASTARHAMLATMKIDNGS